MPPPDPIPISALQHYLFCPRQFALIYIDGLWAENRLTAEGSALHARVDAPGARKRRGPAAGSAGRGRRDDDDDDAHSTALRIAYAVPLLSEALGLIGKADTVEFPLQPDGSPAGPPRPVEHKRGRPKRIEADRVQLCAQALCLEEMLGVDIPEGGLFYHAVRRRERVPLDAPLRRTTLATIRAVRALIDANTVPRAERMPKCRNCSLVNLCLPAGTGPSRTPALYLARSLAASLADEPPSPPHAPPPRSPP